MPSRGGLGVASHSYPQADFTACFRVTVLLLASMWAQARLGIALFFRLLQMLRKRQNKRILNKIVEEVYRVELSRSSA